MGSPPDISVIIVSRDRPDDLRKTLSCLRFQDITGYEVIVVTNTPGALEAAATPHPIRLFDCDEANIPVARNVGLRAARGRFVAFCDDDALPDPAWLRQLLGPFNDPAMGGCGGFTRGRNGISLQWGAVETDRLGTAHPLDIAPDSPPEVFLPAPDKAPVMIGTNCAFRKSALQQIGGFDPAFAYFLDDSDISLRLSQAGWRLAIVPRAEVHHGFASGPYRRQNRVPRTLEPHGKSQAVFCRKHADAAALDPAMAAFRALQFNRLEKQMLAGLMAPPTLTRLIKTLDKGAHTGRHMPLTPTKTRPRPAAEPAPVFSPAPRPHVMLVARKSNRDWLDRLGKKLSAGGTPVTALMLSRTPAFMQVSFADHGYWQHSGGQFGKSARHEPLLQNHSLKTKARAEAARLGPIRPVDLLVYPDKPAAGDIILPQTGVMSCINGFVVESV